MVSTRISLIALASLILLSGVSNAQDARPAEEKAEAPTATGKVTAYEADKSITLEFQQRRETKKAEFQIDKDKTKFELPPRQPEIKVGMVLSVWADKENPKLAVRIRTGGNNPAAPGTRRPNRRPADAGPPGVTGQVAAYEADKSITVEVKQRGGQTRKTEFNIVKDRTKIELIGDTKEIAVGTAVTVWPDEDDAKLAVRIAAGQNNNPQPRPRRPGNNPPNSNAPKPRTNAAPAGDAPAAVIPPKQPRQPVAGLAPLDVARQIDQHIDAVLAADKIPASPQCDDAEFIRRAYLDITGLIPPADKVAAFLDDTATDNRAKLVDELLASPRYGWHFADLWCDRIAVKDMPIYRELFIEWLADHLNKGHGWDEAVFEMLTAEGKFGLLTRGSRLKPEDPRALLMVLNTEAGNPPKPNPALLAAESGRLFLGVQIQCAECHDHPFSESWKQTDFWGLAAFFGEFRAMNANPGLHWEEAPVAAGQAVSITIPPTSLKNIGKIVPARLLSDAQEYQPASDQLLRHSLAKWATAAGNPYFAKATANRLWSEFFGRGLVNPVNDLRPDNPATHPEILELLAEELKKSQFDLQHVIRCICLSQAYQRTSQPLAENEHDQSKYSHMTVKIMGPGMFYDCLAQACGLTELKVGLPERKTKLTVNSQYTPREVFVDFFRASQGEEASPLDNSHGIPQALKLMNALPVDRFSPVVEGIADSADSREKAIEQLYLTTLARRPNAPETQLMADFLEQRKDATAADGYAAVLWALVNSAAFVSNH